MKKVIISCAVTGGAHTPTMSPYLPITPEQIATQSIDAARAGAAIVHLHARQPDGRPTGDPKVFREFVGRIKSETDAIVNISTGGGGPNMAIEERTLAASDLEPELCSLNMGSINLSLAELAERDMEWKHDWEKPFLAGTKGLVFKNTFEDIEWILKNIGEKGTRFEFECYDVGHLYTLDYFVRRGLVKPPFFIQTVFGLRGGIGVHHEDMLHQKRTADRLFGSDYQWSVLAAGKFQLPMGTISAILGGNVRVGLEDSLYLTKGALAESNAAQVTKARRVLEELGLDIATPHEARQLLGLKGGDKVNF